MPPQTRSITLSYTTLFSIIGILVTLKFYHAISSLTHGRKPSRTTLQTLENRIVTGFIRIVQGPAYQSPPPGVAGTGDGTADSLGLHYNYNTLNPTSFQYRENPASAYPYLHSIPRVPGLYPPRAAPRSRTGTGTGTNSINTTTTTPMFHFSAFDLPSNQPRTHRYPHPHPHSYRDTETSSFVQSLAMCAPYQRAGLRLPRFTSQDQDGDGVFGCASVSVSGVRVSPSVSVSEGTPKMTPSEDLRVVNAFPVHEDSPDKDTDRDTDRTRTRTRTTGADTRADLEACLYEPIRLANSFPGDGPVTFGTARDDDAGLARPGSRGKPVISVRPFTDLD